MLTKKRHYHSRRKQTVYAIGYVKKPTNAQPIRVTAGVVAALPAQEQHLRLAVVRSFVRLLRKRRATKSYHDERLDPIGPPLKYIAGECPIRFSLMARCRLSVAVLFM